MDFISDIRQTWLWMLEPPWKHAGPKEDRLSHTLVWIAGWAWSIMGMFLGALLAPSLVQYAGLSNSPYQDWLVILIAVATGFVIQLVNWCVTLPSGIPQSFRGTDLNYEFERASVNIIERIFGWLAFITFFILVYVGFPLAMIVFYIYLYFLTQILPGERIVTVAFVGGLLVKAFLIPLIKSIVTGALIKGIIHLLRGSKRVAPKTAE